MEDRGVVAHVVIREFLVHLSFIIIRLFVVLQTFVTIT